MNKQDQIGGSHYLTRAIQPIEYNERNKLTFSEGSVVKYVTRHKEKNGVEDLQKARHLLDMMIDNYEEWYNV